MPRLRGRRCDIRTDENIKEALIKCATGLSTNETTEEFTVEDGELRLVKKKVVKRDIPPDIKAVRMLLGECGDSTDEELIKEKEKLLSMLKENDCDGNI